MSVSVHPREILYNFLARKHALRTRYGRFRTIHVSDVFSRLDFVYLERLGMLGRDVDELARMYTGIMWEHELIQEFANRGYTHEPEYVGEVRIRHADGTEVTYSLIAHPDFVLNIRRPEHIVELKTTRWSRDEVEGIVRSQLDTLGSIYGYYGKRHREFWPFAPGARPAPPHETFLMYDAGTWPIFYNVMGQIAFYRSIFGWRRRIRYTVCYVYRDGVYEYDIPDEFLRYMYESYVLWRLPYVAYALYLAERFGFEWWMPFYLVLVDVSSFYGLLGYIANDDLAVTSGTTIPIPPIVTPTDKNLWQWKAFEAAFNVNLSEMTFEDSIDVAGVTWVVRRRIIMSAEEIKRLLTNLLIEEIERACHCSLGGWFRRALDLIYGPNLICRSTAKRGVYRYFIILSGVIGSWMDSFIDRFGLPRPASEIIDGPKWFGVRRSPLKLVPELVEEEARALERKLEAILGD